ncbi:hypothetical protein ACHAXT_012456 [Thalassiosira profunda]
MAESVTEVSHATHPSSPGYSPSGAGRGAGQAASGGGASPSTSAPFIAGVSLPLHSSDAATSLQLARQDGFDYVVTSLPDTSVLTGAGSNVEKSGIATPTPRRTDVTQLESKWWSTSVVGSLSDPPRWKSSTPASFSDAGAAAAAHEEGRLLLAALTSASVSAAKKAEAQKIFEGMVGWASHMNIPAVILPSIPLSANINGGDLPAKEYARLLASLVASPACANSRVQLWVRVPLSLQSLRAFQLLLARCDHPPAIGAMLVIDRRLDPADLPSVAEALHVFLGNGNVKAVSWNVSVFLTNKKGYPTLSKNHQFVFSLVHGRLGRTLRTLVEGDEAWTHGTPGTPSKGNVPTAKQLQGTARTGKTERVLHLEYLQHLRARATLAAKLDSEEASLETPYLDSLQSPLQPLGDHLEYQTYETFERDPVKYARYGEAVALALEDGIAAEKFGYLGSTRTTLGQLRRMAPGSVGRAVELQRAVLEDGAGLDRMPAEVDIYQATIMVVGAGRGPLVRESIGAVARVSAKWMGAPNGEGRRRALHAKIVAIEKNPSAVLYLNSLKGGDPSWNGGHDVDWSGDSLNSGEGSIVIPGTSNVTVVGCDMREADGHPLLGKMIREEKARADIVVSELLGSFGDNELSPECLDGVQACGVLKKDCVSIPQSYTAYLAPVSSARLYSEARTQSCLPLNPEEGPASPSVGIQRALETPYVVRSHAAAQTHREKPCWTFAHPHLAADAMDTASDKDASGSNPSADAAKDVNNDRTAHLAFKSRAGAVGLGCGYGREDGDAARFIAASKEVLAEGDGAKLSDAEVTIHGFLGTFESVLYESTAKGAANGGAESDEPSERRSIISISPHSFSVGMFSWFPLYFPLKEPLCVPPGAAVNCSMWRRSDEGRVWYEWSAEVMGNGTEGRAPEVLGTSSLHNPSGRSYHVKK